MKRALGFTLAILALVSSSRALEPDELLLVVNKRVPAGMELARFYANARQVPDGRIVELDLPSREEIPFAIYERDVVPPIREFLRKNSLDKKVTCIVTFYGMPLRVGPKLPNPEEKEELTALRQSLEKLREEASKQVADLEEKAAKADPAFKPAAGDDVEHLAQRAQATLRPLAEAAARIEDPAARNAAFAEMIESVRKLGGPAGVVRQFAGAAAGPEGQAKIKELARQLEAMAAQFMQLQDRRDDPDARKRMRQLAKEGFGVLDEIRITQTQAEYLEPGLAVAALDSELSLLWWTFYPRDKWQPNPMFYRISPAAKAKWGRTVMVMRLDAPQSGQVRQIILSSLKAERDGLKGRVVIDSRGLVEKREQMKYGGYAWYDQTLRDLAEIVRTKTNMPLLLDDSPAVLKAGSAEDVALYCGWYSLRNYVPACRYNAGAVGFHIASSELVSLKGANEKGWVKGLLDDGVAATLGPVAEPYLSAFPQADDFFPLLMTGQKPLAEVYWETVPMTSWMLAMIGDPLYRPYKNKPALQPEDLPDRLKGLLRTPTTRPEM